MGHFKEEDVRHQTQQRRRAEGHFAGLHNIPGLHNTSAVAQADHLMPRHVAEVSHAKT